MKKHYVVIVLGLGEMQSIYAWLTRNWEKKYNIIPIIHVVGWKEKQKDFDKRLSLLVEQVKALLNEKDTIVSVIGISAGTSATINMYSSLKKEEYNLNGRVILLCGRYNFDYHWWYPLSVGVNPYPAFEQSVTLVEENIKNLTDNEKQIFFVYHLPFDEVVPTSASTIRGTHNMVFPFITHFLGILAIFLWSEKMVAILQNIS